MTEQPEQQPTISDELRADLCKAWLLGFLDAMAGGEVTDQDCIPSDTRQSPTSMPPPRQEHAPPLPALCPRCRAGLFRGEEDYICRSCGYHDWLATAKPMRLKAHPPHYTLAEAAAISGTPYRTLHLWCQEGLISNAKRLSGEGHGDSWVILKGILG